MRQPCAKWEYLYAVGSWVLRSPSSSSQPPLLPRSPSSLTTTSCLKPARTMGGGRGRTWAPERWVLFSDFYFGVQKLIFFSHRNLDYFEKNMLLNRFCNPFFFLLKPGNLYLRLDMCFFYHAVFFSRNKFPCLLYIYCLLCWLICLQVWYIFMWIFVCVTLCTGLPTYSDLPLFTPIFDAVTADSVFSNCTPIFDFSSIGFEIDLFRSMHNNIRSLVATNRRPNQRVRFKARRVGSQSLFLFLRLFVWLSSFSRHG